jgi:hypothetical protein
MTFQSYKRLKKNKEKEREKERKEVEAHTDGKAMGKNDAATFPLTSFRQTQKSCFYSNFI